MGMFSWCCKGCGHELKADEFVRMNGCKGTYDGYGRCGGYESDGDDPVCWHEACYKQASAEEKLDETPSLDAPNQGFGYAALAFLKGYKPDADTLFTSNVYVCHRDEEGNDLSSEYYVVKHNDEYCLQDEKLYRKLRDEYSDDEFWDSLPENWWTETSDEECRRVVSEQNKIVDAAIGMVSPSENRVDFDSFAEAKMITERLLDQLPHPERGYTVTINGKQGKLSGIYYERNRSPVYKKVFHGTGQFDYSLKTTGVFDDTVEYMHGEKTDPKKHWSEKLAEMEVEHEC
jgi:hypothetical protein